MSEVSRRDPEAHDRRGYDTRDEPERACADRGHARQRSGASHGHKNPIVNFECEARHVHSTRDQRALVGAHASVMTGRGSTRTLADSVLDDTIHDPPSAPSRMAPENAAANPITRLN